jgi:hypothetical protein
MTLHFFIYQYNFINSHDIPIRCSLLCKFLLFNLLQVYSYLPPYKNKAILHLGSILKKINAKYILLKGLNIYIRLPKKNIYIYIFKFIFFFIFIKKKKKIT